MAEKNTFDDQQTAAIDSDVNTVVSAGAGSGKTRVLTARYIRLISEGKAGVRNILALTFTRKAAAEMYDRIYRSLSLSENPVVREEFSHFSEARICTIDSFCSDIVRSDSHRFGIAPNFAIDDGSVNDLARKAAIDFVLEEAEHPGIRSLIARNGFSATVDRLFADLAFSHFSPSSRLDIASMYLLQGARLKTMFAENYAKIREVVSRISGFKGAESKVIAEAIDRFYGDPVPAAEPDSDGASRIAAWLERTELSLRTGKSAKPEILQYKELVSSFREMKAVLPGICATLASWKEYEGIYGLIDRFQNRYLETRRKNPALGFRELLLLAIGCLRSNDRLRSYLNRQYRYIMIDEFQDNNNLQKELLFLLAEPEVRVVSPVGGAPGLSEKKLFFVGDEKQSIYRFRGADVSVFIRLQEELSLSSPSAARIALPYNYRSAPLLVDFFNDVFRSVMANPTQPFEARFVPMRKSREEPGFRGSVTVMEYFPSAEEDNESEVENREEEEAAPFSAKEAEADAVAKYVADTVGRCEVRSDIGTKIAGYGDFAILLRSRTNQTIFEKSLRRFSIPFVTQNERGIYHESVFRDFYEILRLVVYPSDRNSYAAVLRSPFANLSDDVAMSLLLDFTDEPFPEISADGFFPNATEEEKYGTVGKTYRTLARNADRVPLPSLITYLWFDTGYRFHVLSKPESHPYLDHFDFLYSLAVRAGSTSASLVCFIDTMKERIDGKEGSEDSEITDDRRDAVKILTIHKSKGLEFPIVLLPECDGKGRGDFLGKPYYFSSEFGIALNAGTGDEKRNCFYDSLKQENELQRLAEIKRIFYVALTRAQSRLILSGTRKKNSTRGSFFELLDQAFPDRDYPDYINVTAITDTAETVGASDDRTIFKIDEIRTAYEQTGIVSRTRRRRDYRATEINELVWEKTETPFTGERLPILTCENELKDTETATDFGILCHYFIERILKGDSEPISYPAKLAKRFPRGSLAEIEKEANRLAGSFVRSPRGTEARNAECRFIEYSFRCRPFGGTDPYVVNGQIDLLYVSGQEAVIVDFKTDVEIIGARYAAQIEIYRRAAEAILAKPVRTYLYYLRGAREIEIRDRFDLEPWVAEIKKSGSA